MDITSLICDKSCRDIASTKFSCSYFSRWFCSVFVMHSNSSIRMRTGKLGWCYVSNQACDLYIYIYISKNITTGETSPAITPVITPSNQKMAWRSTLENPTRIWTRPQQHLTAWGSSQAVLWAFLPPPSWIPAGRSPHQHPPSGEGPAPARIWTAVVVITKILVNVAKQTK